MRSLVFALLATGVVVACSSSSGAKSASTEGCQPYASALCAKLDSCAHFGLAVQYGDVATCTTRVAKACALGVNAPGTGVTTANLEACASALGGVSCDDLLTNKPPAACRTPAGTIAEAAPCAEDAQCQSRHCNGSGGECGICTKKGDAGDVCATNKDCDDIGLVCANATCVVPGVAGAACDVTHPCIATLVCKSGTCTKPTAAGAPCDPPPARDCDGIAGFYCDSGSKLCVQDGVASAGQSCAAVPGTPNNRPLCTGGTFCQPRGAIVCLADAADGEPCDLESGPFCLAPATCTNEVCTILDPSTCN
jgi:hypothetical protein